MNEFDKKIKKTISKKEKEELERKKKINPKTEKRYCSFWDITTTRDNCSYCDSPLGCLSPFEDILEIRRDRNRKRFLKRIQSEDMPPERILKFKKELEDKGAI